MNLKNILLLILLLAALIGSAILAFKPLSEICNVEEGCDLVQNSIYAETFGIKNSVYGVAVFSLLSIISLFQIFKPTKRKMAFLKFSLFFGSAIAIYFLALQIFVLKAYCKYCLVVDFSVILALFVCYSPKTKISFV